MIYESARHKQLDSQRTSQLSMPSSGGRAIPEGPELSKMVPLKAKGGKKPLTSKVTMLSNINTGVASSELNTVDNQLLSGLTSPNL